MLRPKLFQAFVLFLLLNSFLHGSEWFVSENGNDAWSGQSPEVSANQQDGPFATLERARDAIRKARAMGDAGAQTVNVRKGTYRLKEAFRLEAQDSGDKEHPVLWKAYKDEKPILTGAFPVKGWTTWKGEIKSAPLGNAVQLKPGVRQLLLGGKRQTLARYPNADPKDPVAGGWAFAGGEGWPMYADRPGEDKHTLEVKEGDLRNWSQPNQVELTVFPRYNWWNSRVRVKAVDRDARKITLASDCSYAIRQGDRYFFQNALEELDAPGEWYADAKEGVLYFWPPSGLNPEDATIVVASSLLRMEVGTHDVVLRGFIFEGCEGMAITLIETERCSVEHNWIRAAGEWNGGGVSVSKGLANRVRYNVIEEVGNTGVSLKGGDVKTLTPAGNSAEHNHIHHFGIFYKQGVGISLDGVGNRAEHNHLHDGPRFAIYHTGNRHKISYNHIHDVSLETEDTGAIYCGGRDWTTPRGTTISYNFIHDVPGFTMHDGRALTPNFAWGIYLDDNSGGADVIGNIVTRCGRGGMHGHGARDCVVENNIFAGNKDWQVDFHGWTTQQNFWDRHLPAMVAGYESVAGNEAWKSMRGMELHPTQVPLPDGLTMRGNRFERNIVESDSAEVPVVSLLRVPFSHNTLDSNLYWAPGGVVRTGFQSAGENEGPDLLGAWEGEQNAAPKGWRLISKVPGNPRAVLQSNGNSKCFLISNETGEENTKATLIYAGPQIKLEPGATYRLQTRVKASIAGKGELAMQSFVNKVYFWMSPRSSIEVGTDWSEREIIFNVPAPGKPGWNDQMSAFSPRISWRCDNGTLEVEDLHLHRVTPKPEIEALRAQGADLHSVVADPLWQDKTKFLLNDNSPAWKLGFKRIPFEEIGPQPEPVHSGQSNR